MELRVNTTIEEDKMAAKLNAIVALGQDRLVVNCAVCDEKPTLAKVVPDGPNIILRFKCECGFTDLKVDAPGLVES